MPFDPVDFYRLADILSKQNGGQYSESYLRATISRAYYSAFLVARNKSGITDNKGRSIHTDVYNHYVNKTGTKRIAARLDILRVARNGADYDMDTSKQFNDAQIALTTAKRVLEELGESI